ncbi:MAG: indolepyruvate oxidoreductase subunit beta [Oscillospiraceae bacterium]|jgi:indolepyruvate ferredoxin oxidoreductase beta subunit|nr:indolepyruvate oxidoreductase subunit beta [Oscillospiraceae bacterium]
MNIMIVGVGGQGTLLASRLLGNAALSQGFDVKVSEVHGMSQRGGSVVTYVKYGHAILSPIIDKGEADIILAFEQLEAARWLPYLKIGGKIIANSQQITPMPVITGAMAYPLGLFDALTSIGVSLQRVDALALAKQAGGAKAVNVVLLGCLAKQLPFKRRVWHDALQKTVKPQFLQMNTTAFDLGYAVQ